MKLRTYNQSQIWLAARGEARSHAVVVSLSGNEKPIGAPALEDGEEKGKLNSALP
jgi:hypothetical protein